MRRAAILGAVFVLGAAGCLHAGREGGASRHAGAFDVGDESDDATVPHGEATPPPSQEPEEAFVTSAGTMAVSVSSVATIPDGAYTRIVIAVDIANRGTEAIPLDRLDAAITDAGEAKHLAIRRQTPPPIEPGTARTIELHFDAENLTYGHAKFALLGLPNDPGLIPIELKHGKIRYKHVLNPEPVLKGIAYAVGYIIVGAIALAALVGYLYVCGQPGADCSSSVNPVRTR